MLFKVLKTQLKNHKENLSSFSSINNEIIELCEVSITLINQRSLTSEQAKLKNLKKIFNKLTTINNYLEELKEEYQFL